MSDLFLYANGDSYWYPRTFPIQFDQFGGHLILFSRARTFLAEINYHVVPVKQKLKSQPAHPL